MATNVSPAVLIFTILCLAFVSNTLEDDFISNYDLSSKDSDEIDSPSALSSRHSSRKIYLPSEWSKEENENLKPSDDKDIENTGQGAFAFGEEFNFWNIKKLFQFFESFLHVVNQNNEGPSDNSKNDAKTKILNRANKDLPDKSENNAKDDELQNSVNTGTQNKSKDERKMQNSSSTDTQNKSSDDWKMQKLWNDGTLDQETKNSEIGMQNSVDENSLRKSQNGMKAETHNLAVNKTLNKSTRGEEMQNFASNNILNKNSDAVEKQNSSDDTQPKENSKIKVENSKDKNNFNKPESTAKTELQNPAEADYLNKSTDYVKLQNSPTNNSVNKSLDNVKMQNPSNKPSSNAQNLTKDSKNKKRNHTNKDYLNDSNNDIQRETISALTSDKSEDLTTITSEGDENSNMNEITSDDTKDNDTSEEKSSEYEVYNDNEKANEDDTDEYNTNENEPDDDYDNEDNTNQNKVEDAYLNKNKYNGDNNDENEIGNDYVNQSNDDNDGNKSTDNIQTHKSAVIADKIAHNTTTIFPKFVIQTVPDQQNDSETCTSRNRINNEITSDDTKANDTSEEETNEYDVYNDNEKENEDDADEYNTNENEFDDNNVNNHDDEDNTNQNKFEDDYLNENKYNGDKNDENETGNDYVNKNNDNDRNNSINSIQTHETAVIMDKTGHNSTVIFPKFVIQTVSDQQNNSETLTSRNPINNNENVASEDAKSQTIENEENTSPKFEITGEEFIDDYINNRQGKIPQRQNEQPNTTEALIPNGKDATNDAILIQIPTSVNNFQESNRFLFTTPSVNENTKGQNIPFEQSQNPVDNFWMEKNILPLPISNEDTKNANPDQTSPNENSQNIQNVSAKKPASSAQENVKTDEVTRLILIPFQQKPHYNDLQYIFTAPHENYNVIAEPTILKIQNDNPSVKAIYDNAPDTNAYRPETTNPFQLIFNKVVPMQNEGYLNDQYTNYFEDAKSPAVINNKNQQLEQKQPIVLKQDMLSDAQYVPNQDTPNSPDETKYFTNYRPEMAMNAPNIETVVPAMEMPSNYWISDNFHYNPSFNQLYNQESSFTDNENTLIKTDKTVPQVQPDATALQNQVDEIKTINMQSQSDNLPSQNIFPGQQILFPQSVTEKPPLESKMNSRTQPDENKIDSEKLPTQDEFENLGLPPSQNNTNNSKVLPFHSFNIAEVNLENKPENGAISSVIPKQNTGKSFFPETKTTSSKPLNGGFEKNVFFDESERNNQEISLFHFDSNKNGSYNESPDREYDEEESYASEYDKEESDESNYNEEESYESEYDEEESNDSEYDEEKSDENEYDGEESDESEYYKEESEKSTNTSDGTTKNATMEISQKSSTDINDVTKSPVTFQTQREAVPYSDQKRDFNTILEYIYKFSDNPLFQDLKD